MHPDILRAVVAQQIDERVAVAEAERRVRRVRRSVRADRPGRRLVTVWRHAA